MRLLKILLAVYQSIIVIVSTIYVVMAIPYVFESGTHMLIYFIRLINFLVVLILVPTIVFCSCNAIKALLPARNIFAKWKGLTQTSIVFTILWTLLFAYLLILNILQAHGGSKQSRQTSVAKPIPRDTWNISPLQAGQITPDFTVEDQFGKTITLSELRGKIVLLDFWGAWCGPCRKKLPDTQKVYDKFKGQGLVVIGIHSSFGTEKTASFLAENNYTFPTGIDTGHIAKDYGVSGWPTCFLIDKEGRLVWGPRHALPSENQIEALLRD